jgi:hypothetical protein
MARPHVFIWWDEFDRQDLPCMCMRCGKKKARWTKWSFEKGVYKNMRNYRRIRKTEIPLCEEHAGFLGFAMITASDYDDEKGVWTMNVHEDFQAALKKHRKAEVKAWKEEEENENADPDDIDDEKLPPGLRREPEKPVRSKVGFFLGMGFFAVVMVIGVIIVLSVCGMFALILGVGMMARRQQ